MFFKISYTAFSFNLSLKQKILLNTFNGMLPKNFKIKETKIFLF